MSIGKGLRWPVALLLGSVIDFQLQDRWRYWDLLEWLTGLSNSLTINPIKESGITIHNLYN